MHDADRGAELKRRVQALTADTTQRWGKMSVDQMLHHVNFVLAEALGEHTATPNIRGLPKPLVRWAILNLPWGKAAPTRPDMLILSIDDRSCSGDTDGRILAALREFSDDGTSLEPAPVQASQSSSDPVRRVTLVRTQRDVRIDATGAPRRPEARDDCHDSGDRNDRDERQRIRRAHALQ